METSYGQSSCCKKLLLKMLDDEGINLQGWINNDHVMEDVMRKQI